MAGVYKIGMLGAGTVGGGVYEILAKRGGASILISKICVRSLEKTRDFAIDVSKTALTTDASDLLTDDIDCLVEVAGGSSGIVKETVLAALKLGKTVVTANKALLAENLPEIQSILKENSKARIGYEAAVCGGIPIIHTLATAYTGDTIQSIRGICNGTTNFMLTAMAKDTSTSYDAILKQAQDLGYAEADPTADVEGHDVRAKIALLAQLAFGGPAIALNDIPCKGISSISSFDFSIAAEQSSTIKLIGVASRQASSVASVYVTPALVSRKNTLASIHGSGNCVVVDSNNMGECLYAGPGAGRFPTANSIVADMDRAATGTLPPDAFSVTNPTMQIIPDYTADGWYIRFSPNSSLASLVASAESCEVHISSVSVDEGWTIITTGPCSLANVEAFGVGNEAALWMPIWQ